MVFNGKRSSILNTSGGVNKLAGLYVMSKSENEEFRKSTVKLLKQNLKMIYKALKQLQIKEKIGFENSISENNKIVDSEDSNDENDEKNYPNPIIKYLYKIAEFY